MTSDPLQIALISIETVPDGMVPLGLVRGSTARSRNIGRDITAILKNVVGGEVTSYTKLMADAREEAIYRMQEDAVQMCATMIVGVRYFKNLTEKPSLSAISLTKLLQKTTVFYETQEANTKNYIWTIARIVLINDRSWLTSALISNDPRVRDAFDENTPDVSVSYVIMNAVLQTCAFLRLLGIAMEEMIQQTLHLKFLK